MDSTLDFRFDNSYAERLEGFYAACDPMPVAAPQLLQFNHPLAEELGLPVQDLDAVRLAQIFSGQEALPGASPLAQAYAGHQFGGFVPQLGDGRALLVGEVMDQHGRRRDIAFKGSGPTPFSRGGDGKAAVGPVLREYLIGEAMHALGIPTTRALAAVGTGQSVRREVLLPGAILTRVAASHLRVGTFEYFAARQQHDLVRQLADYVIERHDPDLGADSDRYWRLLDSVAERQARLLAQWMLVGFIHGVMNTDNMTISGETIDYGPCAFLEAYRPEAVFSSIDSGGRYAYGNQPVVARWNLARLAETLLPLIDDQDAEKAIARAMEVIEGFLPRFEAAWLVGARAKLALPNDEASERDQQLVVDWLSLLEEHEIDFTAGWRSLASAADGEEQVLLGLFTETEAATAWLKRWQERIAGCSAEETAKKLRAANPCYIPRNHLVEEALSAASDDGDLMKFARLLEVLQNPYQEQAGCEDYACPAPAAFTACYKTFCGT